MKPISDMYFAAALIAYGIEYEKADVVCDNGRKQVFFSFPEKGMTVYRLDNGEVCKVELDIESCYNSFQSRKLMFPPDYPNSIRNVKSVIYNVTK